MARDVRPLVMPLSAPSSSVPAPPYWWGQNELPEQSEQLGPRKVELNQAGIFTVVVVGPRPGLSKILKSSFDLGRDS